MVRLPCRVTGIQKAFGCEILHSRLKRFFVDWGLARFEKISATFSHFFQSATNKEQQTTQSSRGLLHKLCQLIMCHCKGTRQHIYQIGIYLNPEEIHKELFNARLLMEEQQRRQVVKPIVQQCSISVAGRLAVATLSICIASCISYFFPEAQHNRWLQATTGLGSLVSLLWIVPASEEAHELRLALVACVVVNLYRLLLK